VPDRPSPNGGATHTCADQRRSTTNAGVRSTTALGGGAERDREKGVGVQARSNDDDETLDQEFVARGLDLGSLLRLRSVADALGSMEPGSLQDPAGYRRTEIAYAGRVRALASAALDALDADRADLLLDLIVDPASEHLLHNPESAPATLAVLRGYLHGCVDELTFEAQVRANAEAYGRAKARAETRAEVAPEPL
jgi:hypothetical protein